MIKIIGVVGAGQMGTGIAQTAAMAGFEVILYDVSDKLLSKSLEFIKDQLHKGREKGKWNEQYVLETLERIQAGIKKEPLSVCDLIIEAATENKQVKFTLFKSLDEVVKKDAVLTSNTSSISITEIAAQTNRPNKVMGMHFMNPVPIMKLVEGIRGVETDDMTFNVVKNTAEKMGKTFVSVKDFPGFAVNRILMPMINEAIFALYEGIATPEDIDSAMRLGTNQPMGPLALADFIGLDTCLAIMDVLYEGFKDSKYRPCPLLKKYVMAGRLGKKSGKGFYIYG
jgi:3-hydroxybutyryl-CoA dehydrogenase